MMPIKRTCQGCSEDFETADAIDGTERCPHCGTPLNPFMSLPDDEPTDGFPFDQFATREQAGISNESVARIIAAAQASPEA